MRASGSERGEADESGDVDGLQVRERIHVHVEETDPEVEAGNEVAGVTGSGPRDDLPWRHDLTFPHRDGVEERIRRLEAAAMIDRHEEPSPDRPRERDRSARRRTHRRPDG